MHCAHKARANHCRIHVDKADHLMGAPEVILRFVIHCSLQQLVFNILRCTKLRKSFLKSIT
jgi:hypothetical protein